MLTCIFPQLLLYGHKKKRAGNTNTLMSSAANEKLINNYTKFCGELLFGLVQSNFYLTASLYLHV